MKLWPPKIIFAFWVAAFWASVVGQKLVLHLLRCFVGSVGSYPQNTYCQKFEICVEVKPFETDTWQCPVYLAGTDLVKVSRWKRSKLCKQQRGRREGGGDPRKLFRVFFALADFGHSGWPRPKLCTKLWARSDEGLWPPNATFLNYWIFFAFI